MSIRIFSDQVRVLSIGRNPIQVLLIRSTPVRVLSIRSDPIRSNPGFVNAPIHTTASEIKILTWPARISDAFTAPSLIGFLTTGARCSFFEDAVLSFWPRQAELRRRCSCLHAKLLFYFAKVMTSGHVLSIFT